jgi:hypothetical protein
MKTLNENVYKRSAFIKKFILHIYKKLKFLLSVICNEIKPIDG